MNSDLLLKYFDRISDARDAIPRLHSFILDLAVRGKLVEQNLKDEPASELLKRIQTEKVRLLKNDKIGKQQPVTQIQARELPFLPPPGWVWARLATISCRIHYGYTASANHSLRDVRLLRITDIQNNIVDWASVPGCEISEREAEQYELQQGDILIARTGGTIGKTFLVNQIPVKAVFASYLIRVQPSSELSDSYLKLFLESPVYWKQLQRGARGGGQPNVNGQTLGRMTIAVPPIAEQQRIVAKVDELTDLCNRLKHARSKRDNQLDFLGAESHRLVGDEEDGVAFKKHAFFFVGNLSRLTARQDQIKHFRQTVLNLAVRGRLVTQDPNDESATDLVGRIQSQRKSLLNDNTIRKTKACRTLDPNEVPHAIPTNWQWIRLAEITDIGTGSTPSRTQPLFWNGAIPWVTSGSTSLGVINKGDEFVTEAAVKSHRLRLYQPGTLLVALYGQGKTRGQVAELAIESTINQACAAICPLPGFESILPYLKILLAKNYDEVRSLSAGGPQPNLNVQKIKELLVPLPPIREQRRIATEVTRLLSLCDRLETLLATAHSETSRLLDSVLYFALNDSHTSIGTIRAIQA